MPSKTPSVALGAAVYTVVGVGLTFLTFRLGGAAMYASLCGLCGVIVLAPGIAVWHYATTHRRTLLAGEGAGLGAIAGLAGALLSAAVTQVLMAVNALPDQAEQIEIQRANMIAMGMDPAQVSAALASASTGVMSNPLVAIVLSALLAAAVGAGVGALAASAFKRGEA